MQLRELTGVQLPPSPLPTTCNLLVQVEDAILADLEYLAKHKYVCETISLYNEDFPAEHLSISVTLR